MAASMTSDRPEDQTYNGQGQSLDTPLWDTLVLAATGLEFDMFQVGQGGTAPGGAVKTESDTNMPANGEIPYGQDFDVHAVRIEYYEHAEKAAATDLFLLFNFLFTATLDLTVLNAAPFLQTHVSEIMGIPLGVSFTPAVAGNFEAILSQGMFKGYKILNKKIPLNNQTRFHCYIRIPAVIGATTLVGDSLRVYLLGEYTKRSA